MFSVHGRAQSTFFQSSDTLNTSRLIGASITEGGLWGGSIGGLYFVWYKDFPKTKFHFFNDMGEWQQMDKMGHLTTAWNFARLSGGFNQWAGVSHKKSVLIGSLYSFAYMTTFEVLDAYNEAWGFSFPDVLANSSGIVLYAGQELLWQEQRIKLKFSAHHTSLAALRPDVLGDSFTSRLFKDYNGQTYWLSSSPFQFIKTDKKWLDCIQLSVGYSINRQLIGDGSTYVSIENGEQMSFTPYRQYFLSLDLDWEQIPTNKKWLKWMYRTLNVVKIPFPTLEFSKGKWQAHAIYF